MDNVINLVIPLIALQSMTFAYYISALVLNKFKLRFKMTKTELEFSAGFEK